MNFDALLEDELVHTPVISGRVSTIIDDTNYPSVDDYKPFAKQNLNKRDEGYPGFVQQTEVKPAGGYHPVYPDFVDNSKQQIPNKQYAQSNYPTIDYQ